MAIPTTIEEQRIQRRSKRVSIAIHVILLLLLFILWRMPLDPEKNIDTQYAVAVNFTDERSSASFKSQSTAGAEAPQDEKFQRAETEPTEETEPVEDPVEDPEPIVEEPEPVVEEPEPVIEDPEPVVEEPETVEEPEPVVEEPKRPVFSRILDRVSDVIASSDPVVIEDPKPVEVPESKPKTSSKKTKKSNKSGSISEKASKTKTSGNDGQTTSPRPSTNTGSGKADSGPGAGSDKTGNDGDSGIGNSGAGVGEYDDSGNGVFGRKVVYRDPSMITNASGKSGKIAFKVCINRRGTVTYVEIINSQTTIRDKKLLKQALSALQKYKYAPDFSAPREQCGKYTLIVDNIHGIRGN